MGMQNETIKNDEQFRISLHLIGEKMGKFLKELSGSNKTSFAKDRKDKKELQDFWDYHYEENLTFEAQLNNAYQLIDKYQENTIEKVKFKECLIIKIKNIKSLEIETIFKKQNRTTKKNKDYSPLILFLLDEFDELTDELKVPSNYKHIEPRGIFLSKYQEFKGEKDNNFENILYILYRFCSYHNDLGDIIELGDGKDNIKTYDLVQRHYPFNLNICCIGKFGEGKSTGVNFILGELKAKEGNLGLSQTTNLSYYYHKSMPIRVLDIPGFEGEETVQKCIQKIKNSSEEALKYQEKMHILLYFMNFTAHRTFLDPEKKVLLELNKNKDFQLIYVITHYKKYIKEESDEEEDVEEEEKNQRKTFIKKINNGLHQKTEHLDNSKEIYTKFEASENNVVFVNFYNEKNNPQYGIEDLFIKIKECFLNTEEYKIFKSAMYNLTSIVNDNSEENKEKIIVKETKDSKNSFFEGLAKILRKKVESEMRKYRISGTFLRSIPFVNRYFSQEWLNNKVIKVISEIYNIEIKYEENENDEKAKNENIKKSLPFKIINAKYENKEDDPLIGYKIDPNELYNYTFYKYADKYDSFSNYYFKAYGTLVISDICGVATQSINAGLSTFFSAISSGALLGCMGILVAYSAYTTNKHIDEIINQVEEIYLKSKKTDIYFSYYLINMYLDIKVASFSQGNNKLLNK